MSELTWAQVANWRMKRQHLAEQAEPGQMLDVIRDVCGVQAQVMSAAEFAICARVRGITLNDVRDALWQERALVKSWTMRGTLHLHTSDDLPLYVAAMRPTKTSYLRASWQKGHGITAADIQAILAAVPKVLDGQTLTREELADEIARQTGSAHLKDLLLSGWGALLKPSAFQGDLCFGPNRGRSVTFMRPDQWVKDWREIDGEEAVQTILRRFLTRYGPATRADFNRWWGVEPHKSRALFDSMKSELVEVKIEGYKAVVLASDVEAMSAADEKTAVRLLPNFDPYTVADHNHTRRLLPPDLKARVYRAAGWISPVVLVNGRVEGVWEHEQKRDQLTVTVELFAAVSREVKSHIEAEAARLADLLGASPHVIYS